MTQFTLSAFADEASPEFDRQIAALHRKHIPLMEIRGVDGKPFTMGGGTYARHFKNAISFGTESRLSRFLILWVRYIPLMRESVLTVLRCH